MPQIPAFAFLLPTPPVVPPQMTADEFMRRHAHDRVELVCGVVKEKPMPSFKHGRICLIFSGELHIYLKAHDVGRAGSNDSLIRLSTDPALVRAPDICFFSYERLPRGEVPDGVLTVLPEMAAEMRSPSDSWSD